MFRFLLSAVSIFVLLTATLILPEAVSARRCGMRMPLTLLSLYRNSELIYVATYDKSEEGEPTEETTEYTTLPIRKHFSVSSALKGETRKMLVLSETEYRYKNQESGTEEKTEEESGTETEGEGDAANSEEETVEIENDDASELSAGDSVLLFLNNDEDSDVISLSDDVDGIKKMTPDSLAAYSLRIRELNEIFASESPTHAELVAWLVRSAEDPATRWEGTYELLRSFQNMEWQAERAKETMENPQPEGPHLGEYEVEKSRDFETGDVNFARALTEGQKLILTNILLNRAPPENSAKDREQVTKTRGDEELIELVKRWGDSTVAVNLVEHLRHISSDTGASAGLMSAVAAIFGDDKLESIADEYSAIQWDNESDPIAIDADEPEVIATDESTETVPETAGTNAETESAGELMEESTELPVGEESGAKRGAKIKTYGELRAELLARFLGRAEILIGPAREN